MNTLKNYWDYLSSNGQTYQMGAQSHRVWLLDLLKEKKVVNILDVGCGTGPIYQLIKEEMVPSKIEDDFLAKRWNFEYKGTDYSEGMIEVCKKEFPEANWEVEDARHLTESDNSFDCVLLMHCLDHLDDYAVAIKEAARVARGWVLIVLWRGVNYAPGAVNNLNDKNMYGKEPGEEPWTDTHLQDYAWEPLKLAFAEAGLEIELVEEGPEVNKEGKSNTVILLKKKV